MKLLIWESEVLDLGGKSLILALVFNFLETGSAFLSYSESVNAHFKGFNIIFVTLDLYGWVVIWVVLYWRGEVDLMGVSLVARTPGVVRDE